MRTVVLLCEHNREGSFGLVLNRPYDHTLADLITGLENHPLPVYYGGPVQQDTLHFLHQLPEAIEGGQEILPGVFWGGNFETVTQLLREDALDADKIRFYIGYSGWSSGQLESELEEKSWLTVQGSRRLAFHPRPDAIWKDALREMGGPYEQLINYPIDPQLN